MVTMRYALAIAFLATAATSSARPGANHHLGDDSFVATFGRAPTPHDGEALRMHTHLVYVHDLLAARAATRPELAARRAQLLRYLDDYIAKGTTPNNTYTSWRNPVFIDATGNICAVGYLIERDVGRALPEKIAAEHRLDYLETIAKAMPEVAAWVDGSGFTLEELASIQPGYEGPEVQHVDGWDAKQPIVDGPYSLASEDGYTVAGAFENKQMTGAWKRTDKDGKVFGSGTFKRGAGTWTSFRADGTKLAQGPFEKSKANGAWKIFFRDGKVAATGAMKHGKRAGTWTFHYDDAKSTVLARGPFVDGQVVGPWHHYNEHGKLVATATGKPWGTLTLDIEPGADGVRHQIDQGIPAAANETLDGFYIGVDKFYVENGAVLYDEHGYQIDKVDGAWHARDCKWSAKKKSAARAGDVAKLHNLLMQHDDEKREECSADARKFTAAEIARLDKVLASRSRIHAPIPNVEMSFVEPAAEVVASDGQYHDSGEKEEHIAGVDNPEDMATYLTRNMTWYMEWPYVDQPFVAVYLSLPGYRSANGHLQSCAYGNCS
jgi:hypothetical protein